MKTQIKIIKFWLTTNFNQIFIILTILYIAAQLIRVII
jgi:hypothetical protein